MATASALEQCQVDVKNRNLMLPGPGLQKFSRAIVGVEPSISVGGRSQDTDQASLTFVRPYDESIRCKTLEC